MKYAKFMYNKILDNIASGKQFTLSLLNFFLITLNAGIMIIRTTNTRFTTPNPDKLRVISLVLKKILNLKG